MSEAKTYLFNSDLLFSDERTRVLAGEIPDQAKVVPLTLRCINVSYSGTQNFMGSNTWRFQVDGHGENWYRTHYHWALIEDTPENRAKAERVHAIHAERARLLTDAVSVSNTIVTVKVKP